MKAEGAGMILPLTMNLQERFDVARSEELASGTQVLYLARPRS